MFTRRTSGTLALRLIVGALVLILLGYGVYRFIGPGKPFSEQSPPPPGPITIKGEMLCLPHRDISGAQTTECAFGLRDDAGRYFGLRDADPYYRNVASSPMGQRVEIFGTFEPRVDETYVSVGIIEVHGIDPIER